MREYRVEVVIEHDGNNDLDLNEVYKNFQNIVKMYKRVTVFEATDSVIDNRTVRQICPHCNKLISGLQYVLG